ncbi:MAG: glycoside hydrolase family 5 protein [Puniceicoccaceae bacterium]
MLNPRPILPLVFILWGCTLSTQETTQRAEQPEAMPQTTFQKGVNLSHYLSQTGRREYAEPGFIVEEDLAWIAARGYDHIRLPVDGPLLINKKGQVRKERLPALDQTINWAHRQGLGVLLDVHKLPGSTFSGDIDSRLFTDPKLQEQAIGLWRILAERYKHIGPELRFEILNEPVADNDQVVTAFYAKVLASIREFSGDRVVYLCPNRWGRIESAAALKPLLDDPNVMIDVHYYEPHIFTHQKASWVGSDIPGIPDIPFPGTIPDLRAWLPGHHYGHDLGGTRLTKASIEKDLRHLKEWALRNDVEVYIGEFGVYEEAPAADRENWYRAVMDAISEEGFGWAVWDYKGGFAVRNARSGQPTLVQSVLDDYLD